MALNRADRGLSDSLTAFNIIFLRALFEIRLKLKINSRTWSQHGAWSERKSDGSRETRSIAVFIRDKSDESSFNPPSAATSFEWATKRDEQYEKKVQLQEALDDKEMKKWVLKVLQTFKMPQFNAVSFL